MLPKAAIFDMDGVLIDSEPLWREAEIKLFVKAGIYLTDSLCEQAMGLRIDEVIDYWYNKNPQANYSKATLQADIITAVKQLIIEKGEAMPGVYTTLDYLKSKNIKLAIASSSFMILIETVVQKLNLEKYFDVLHSAEFEIQGKPHPAIYSNAAKKLNVLPSDCIAIEDSIAGLKSATAAGMKTIAVPDKNHFYDERFNIATVKIKSLLDFNEQLLSI
jgi:sugar-phosphatase